MRNQRRLERLKAAAERQGSDGVGSAVEVTGEADSRRARVPPAHDR